MGPALEVELHHRLSRLELDAALTVEGGTLALVGPSGAGKSTVVRAIAGLIRPDRGRVAHGSRVLLDTERNIELPPEERRVGVVYQDGALFPFMSVIANVAYGITADGRTREERARAVLDRF